MLWNFLSIFWVFVVIIGTHTSCTTFQPLRAFIQCINVVIISTHLCTHVHIFMYLIKALNGQNNIQLVCVPIITTKKQKLSRKLQNKVKINVKTNINKLLCTITRVHKQSSRCGFRYSVDYNTGLISLHLLSNICAGFSYKTLSSLWSTWRIHLTTLTSNLMCYLSPHVQEHYYPLWFWFPMLFTLHTPTLFLFAFTSFMSHNSNPLMHMHMPYMYLVSPIYMVDVHPRHLTASTINTHYHILTVV